MTVKLFILIICCSVKIIWATPEYFIEIDSINCTAYPKATIWLRFKSHNLKKDPVDSTKEIPIYTEGYADFSHLKDKKWYTNNTYGKVLACVKINDLPIKENNIKIRKLNSYNGCYCNFEISCVSNLKMDSLSHFNIGLSIEIYYQQDYGECTYILLPSDKLIWNKSNMFEIYKYLMRKVREKRKIDSLTQ